MRYVQQIFQLGKLQRRVRLQQDRKFHLEREIAGMNKRLKKMRGHVMNQILKRKLDKKKRSGTQPQSQN